MPSGWRRCCTERWAAPAPQSRLLSGGNIDPTLLISVMRHGLALAGRYLVVRSRCPTGRASCSSSSRSSPGEPRTSSTSSTAARVPAIAVGETEIRLTLVTRDEEHCDQLLATMRSWGYLVERRVMKQERKVVTVLFADLVGFTARAEQMDPEDVARLLAPYHARLRARARALRRHGGEVHRRRGDGASSARPSRTRTTPSAPCALRSPSATGSLTRQATLEVRIGVNTGEALVTLDARPDAGRGHGRGRRRQHRGAPPGGGAGERHPRRRDDVPGDRARDRVPGARRRSRRRARPSRCRCGRPSRRAPASARTSPLQARTPLVGRDASSTLLADALARVRQELEPQLVTARRRARASARAGSCCELFRVVDADPELICVAAGPLASRTARASATGRSARSSRRRRASSRPTRRRRPREKLARAVADLVADAAEAQWIESHLRPLVGLARRARRRRRPARGGLRRLAALPRGARRAQPARARLRGPPLGRRRAARLRRLPRRLGDRRAAARRLHGAAGAARAAAGLGRRQAQRDDGLALAALRRGHGRLVAGPAGAGRAAGRGAGGAARACGRQPALRGGVRAHASRARLGGRPAAARDRAGDDRRPARRPSGGGEGARSRTRPWSARSSGRRARGDRRRVAGTSSRSGCTRSSARSSCAASGARRSPARRSTPSARARARRRLRPDPARRACREAPPGRRVDRVASAGRRTTPRCSLTTTSSALEFARAAGGRGRAPRLRAGRSALRGAGDRAPALNAFARRAALLRAAALELWPNDDPGDRSCCCASERRSWQRASGPSLAAGPRRGASMRFWRQENDAEAAEAEILLAMNAFDAGFGKRGGPTILGTRSSSPSARAGPLQGVRLRLACESLRLVRASPTARAVELSAAGARHRADELDSGSCRPTR